MAMPIGNLVSVGTAAVRIYNWQRMRREQVARSKRRRQIAMALLLVLFLSGAAWGMVMLARR